MNATPMDRGTGEHRGPSVPAPPGAHDARWLLSKEVERALEAHDPGRVGDTELPLSPFFSLVHHPRLSQLDQVRLAHARATSVLVDLASRPDLAPGALAALVGRRVLEVDRELMRTAALSRAEQLDLLTRRPEAAQHLAMNEFLDPDVATRLTSTRDPDVLAALAMNTSVPLDPSFLYRDCRWTHSRSREVDAFLVSRGVDPEAVASLGPSWDGDLADLAEVCTSFAPDTRTSGSVAS